MLDVADDIIELCERTVEENNNQKRARISAGETLTNAQKSKAILVTCRNVNNINAETVLSRHRDLRILYNHLHELGDDIYDWAIPLENIRPTLNWSGRWGPQEDSMLLVGAFLYGFGNWEQMVKDPKLGLEGKFFLEEGKKGEDSASRPIPNAIHLVRRGDFLLSILREHDEKLRSYESSLRNKGQLKVSTSPPPTAVASSSHTSSLKRRAESEAVASVDDNSSRKRKRRPTPTFTDSESSDEWSVTFCVQRHRGLLISSISPSMDEASTKEELRPVKKQLVSTFIINAFQLFLMSHAETTQVVGRGNAARRQGRDPERFSFSDWPPHRACPQPERSSRRGQTEMAQASLEVSSFLSNLMKLSSGGVVRPKVL